MAERDPLSVSYDAVARAVLLQAVRRLRNHQRGPVVWIASTRAELRQPDKGGRSKQERAFTRAAYYQVFKVPRNASAPVHYSLTLDWSDQLMPAGRPGRLARSCRVTLHRYGVRGPGGGKPVNLQDGGPWVVPPGSMHSEVGNRIDG